MEGDWGRGTTHAKTAVIVGGALGAGSCEGLEEILDDVV